MAHWRALWGGPMDTQFTRAIPTAAAAAAPAAATAAAPETCTLDYKLTRLWDQTCFSYAFHRHAMEGQVLLKIKVRPPYPPYPLYYCALVLEAL